MKVTKLFHALMPNLSELLKSAVCSILELSKYVQDCPEILGKLLNTIEMVQRGNWIPLTDMCWLLQAQGGFRLMF